MSNANKKPKTADDDSDEFFKVRRYILDCPHVAADHPAIKAALNGIDQEVKRRERDAKLQKKFMQDAVNVEKPRSSLSVSARTTEEKHEGAGQESHKINHEDETMTDDWHDISDDNGQAHAQDFQDSDTDSFLGKKLAKEAIAQIAQFQVRVKSPVNAIALALHACLRSDTLGFSCTGVPDEANSAAAAGFAAPIRELPKTQFLPREWDKSPSSVRLRYRKNGTGSIILEVEQQQEACAVKDIVVEVTLYPSSTPEPPSESLTFPLVEHINLDSWERAFREQNTVAPALHYKALSSLLTNFAKAFDLGSVQDERDAAGASMQEALPYVDTTIQNLPSMQQTREPFINGQQPPMRPVNVNEPWDDGRPTIDSAFPGLHAHDRPGDFAGDLTPGGVQGPHFGRIDPSQGGMVMGPGHPIFQGGVSGVGPDSGFGMQPRFDPFGPPGGPTDPNGIPNGSKPKKDRKPGGSGDPNPDHLRPPSNLNNNMFM